MGQIAVVQPETTESHWQPVPANGHIEVMFAPNRVAMDHPLGLGTQTVAVGGYVREHAHDRNEEVIYMANGKGRAVLDGENRPMAPGSAIFIGKNRRPMFINEGQDEMTFVWLIVSNGLEGFFRLIGRSRQDGEPDPEPFARPVDVLEIERQTVFAAQPADQRQP